MTAATATCDLSTRLRDTRPHVIARACRRNARRLRLRMARAWRRVEPMPPAKWLREIMRLDNTVEASSGRYDLAGRPWWRAILAAIADPTVESIAIPAATQVGKTLSLLAAILWIAENAPAPAMLVAPDRDTAVELAQRLYLNAEASIRGGKVKRIKLPPERLRNNRYIDLGSMRVYMAWSGSRQRLRGRPCRYVFLTEIDVYASGHKTAGDPVSAAHQRTKAFFRGLHYHESSPSSAPSRITDLERQATARYRWHVPCPHCACWQELRFFVFASGKLAGRGGIGGLKDETGDYVSPEIARESAHYVCEAGCRIDNDAKQAMLARGCWVPFGCRIDQAAVAKQAKQSACKKHKQRRCREERPCIDGRRCWRGPLLGERPKSRRKLGFHLWSMHSEATSFGDLAAAFLEHKEQGRLAEFFGNWLGLAFTHESRVPNWAQLGKKAVWSNARRQMPREAWFLTAGADKQGENNGVRYVVRGWAPGRTSWLVDWGWLERTPGDETELVKSDLVQLTDAVLKDGYPVIDEQQRPAENPLGRKQVQVKLLCIDSNHLPMAIHNWMRWLPEGWIDRGTGRVRAIRGDHQLNPDTRWQLTNLETNTRDGTQVYEGGMEVWRLRVYPFYDELLQLLAGEPGRSGSWHVTSDCLTQGKAYLEQVVNFGQRTEWDPKSGKKKQVWGPRNGRVPIDFFDCEIYALAAAHMVVGDLGWSADAWEAWRRGAVQPKTAAARKAHNAQRRSADAGRLDDR